MTFSLLAQASPANNGGLVALLTQFLPFILLGIVFWFLFIRPQKKEAERLAKFRSNLKVGDEILTNQGIFGTIRAIERDTVMLEIARSTKIKILKSEVRMSAKEFNAIETIVEEEEKTETKSA